MQLQKGGSSPDFPRSSEVARAYEEEIKQIQFNNIRRISAERVSSPTWQMPWGNPSDKAYEARNPAVFASLDEGTRDARVSDRNRSDQGWCAWLPAWLCATLMLSANHD
eukprot:gene30836-35875_t